MDTFLDRWLPPAVRDGDPFEARRARMIVGFALATAPWGPFFAVIYFALDRPALSVLLAAATASVLAVPLLLRRTGRVAACGHVVTATLFVAVGGICWWVGGSASPAAPWMAVIPLVGALFGGARTGAALGAICVGALAALYLADVAHLTPPVPFAPEAMRFLYLAGFAGLIVCATSMALVHGAVRDEALGRLEATATDLSAEVDEHRATRADLAAANRHLVDQARAAGKAEIAASVLHNVGNALNHVHRLSGEIAATVSGIRAERARDLAALMAGQREAFEQLLGPRGDRMCAYAEGFAGQLAADRAATLELVRELGGALDHVDAIVRQQQSNAGLALVREPVEVNLIVSEALRFAHAAGVRAPVQVDVPPNVAFELDRHVLVQILVNLLRNAQEALTRGATAAPRITVWARFDTDRLRMEVVDNGPGIAQDDLCRLFRHGFTTREGGHGLGLHWSALAARSMGGRLEGHNVSTGTGARFVLDISAPASAAPQAVSAG